MLTSSKLAEELGLTKNTVLKLANEGRIPCIKLPTARGDYRFDLDEVVEALRKRADDAREARV